MGKMFGTAMSIVVFILASFIFYNVFLRVDAWQAAPGTVDVNGFYHPLDANTMPRGATCVTDGDGTGIEWRHMNTWCTEEMKHPEEVNSQNLLLTLMTIMIIGLIIITMLGRRQYG